MTRRNLSSKLANGGWMLEEAISLVKIINDPANLMSRLLASIRATDQQGRFVLCLGSTRTSDVPGISAAGTKPALRRLTPAVDAELLVLGRANVGGLSSVLAPGMVSPVVITRACAKLLQWDIVVVDCGVFQRPKVDLIVAGERVADCLSTGEALPIVNVESLFKRGVELGHMLSQEAGYLVIAECVPGGTTTALGLLTALGYKVKGLLSSSLPASSHKLPQKLVDSGIAKTKTRNLINNNPLSAAAAMGDPMQPFAAGLTLAASDKLPVVLGGGSQMMAVYALTAAILKSSSGASSPRAGACTTKWVVKDPKANTEKLSRIVNAPLACSLLDFTLSCHSGLRSYENGHVKEGVGAGAAMLLTLLSGRYSQVEILKAIDETCDQLTNNRDEAN